MRNKQDRRVFTTNQQENVYIVNKITSNLNKFAFIVVIQYDVIVFLTNNNIFDQEYQINQIEVDTNDAIISNFKAKIYGFWNFRFVYLNAIKLQKLHEIFIFSKFVFIVDDAKNLYKVCALIKLYNKKNYYVNKRKIVILAFVSIDICELLSLSILKYKYFFEIVNNYFYRI